MRDSIVLAAWIVGSLCLLAWPFSTSSAFPVGEEITVSSHRDDPATTADNDQEAPAVAMDADGNFVIVFQRDTPGRNISVAARLYLASGLPRGPEFMVNTTGPNDRMAPQVAMNGAGEFVVVWADNFADSTSDGIMARYYHADGEPKERFDREDESLGKGNFRVNSPTRGQQYRAAVAIADSGNVVIVWQENRFGGDFRRRIRGRVYSAQGYALSGELAISEDETIDHSWPRVAVDGEGNFAVAWESGKVGRNTNLALRRFDAQGNAYEPAILANISSRVAHASGVHRQSDIAMDATGHGIVAWNADNFSGPGVVGAALGILARRFTADGQFESQIMQIDDERAPVLNHPTIAMNASGDYVIAHEASDQSLSGIRVQQYYQDGTRRGQPIQANIFETLLQARPAIALDRRSNAIVSWQSSNQDEAGKGVFARRLSGLSARPAVDFNRDGIGDLAVRHRGNGMNAIITLAAAGLGDVQTFMPVTDQRWQNVGQADFDCDGHTDFFWRNNTSGENAILFMNGATPREIVLAPALTDTRWRVAGVGHFERDCYNDILWRHVATGEWLLWLLNDEGLTKHSVIRPGTDWHIAAVADFNQDRRADILARANTGENAIVLMNGAAITDIKLIDEVADNHWQIVAAADFDADRTTDLFWRNASTGQNALVLMDQFAFGAVQLIAGFSDTLWQVVGVRDATGKRRNDLLWRHSGNGSLQRMALDGFTTSTTTLIDTSDPQWSIIR